MAKQKKNSGEKEPVSTAAARSGMPVHAWIDQTIGDALKRYLHSMEVRITATSVIEVALKEFLQKRGFWPQSGSNR